MAAKLTEIVKKEMLEGFSNGESLKSLSNEYGCTPSTVTRAVKSFLTEDEFARLKNNRKKKALNQNVGDSLLEKDPLIKKTTVNHLSNTSILESQEKSKDDSLDMNYSGGESSNDAEAFTEVIPLSIEAFSEEQREVACQPLASDSLPSPVFMLINKNNELESKLLKEFSDWSFLPETDQNRLAIPLFSTLRAAKRTCSRNQKVLKVPDSKVFLISLSYLISKGITRLIIDEVLISLDL